MPARYPVIAFALALAIVAAAGCEHIHDPWVSEGEHVEDGRMRSAELSKTLDERALHQAGR